MFLFFCLHPSRTWECTLSNSKQSKTVFSCFVLKVSRQMSNITSDVWGPGDIPIATSLCVWIKIKSNSQSVHTQYLIRLQVVIPWSPQTVLSSWTTGVDVLYLSVPRYIYCWSVRLGMFTLYGTSTLHWIRVICQLVNE
jgi:hypothetical protein